MALKNGCEAKFKRKGCIVSKSELHQPGRSPRVLFQSRPNVFLQRGGDTVVLERFVEGLKQRGYEVHVDVEGSASPADYDLVHLFNFATPSITSPQAEQARLCDTPYVVTSLYEETAQFHAQSHYVAGRLVDYVASGQQPGSYSISYRELSAVPNASKFEVQDIVRHASAILPNGVCEGNAIRRDYPYAGPVHVVPVGIDPVTEVSPQKFVETFGIQDFILCVGRIESRKNQLMLLKALEDSEYPVVLVGGGFSYQPDYDRAVRNFNRKGKTVVVGRLDDEMLASAYAACRIHVLPSWFELPGLVTLEAAARGKNVVVTRTGTTHDYIGDKAFYCLPWDADSIRSAVYAAFNSPVQNGIVSQATQHTWQRAVECLDKIYQDIINESEVNSSERVEVVPNDVVSREPSLALRGVKSMNAETDRFEKLLEQGETAAKSGDFARATELLAQAEEISPDAPSVLKARGAVFLAQMDPTTAISYFDRALSMDANDPKLLTGRGMCDLVQKQHASAAIYFERALRLKPDYIVALHQLLECAYTIGTYEMALESVRRFLSINPADTNIRFCLAGCLYQTGQFADALRELEIVRSEAPEYEGAQELANVIESALQGVDTPEASQAESQKNLMESYSSSDVKESLQELSKSVASWTVGGAPAPRTQSVAPLADKQDDIAIANALSAVEDQKRSKEFAAARNSLDAIIAGGISDPTLRRSADCLRAELLVVDGDLEGAGAIYEAVLAEDATMTRALCGKGALAAESQDWLQAQNYFEKALAIDVNCDIAYAGMGLCAMVGGNEERAFELFEIAAVKNPENQRALLGVLQTGYPLKKYNEMERMLASYLNLHPASIDMLYSLAGVLYAQGKVSEAKLEVDKILIFEPEHEHALELQEMIKEKANTPENGRSN